MGFGLSFSGRQTWPLANFEFARRAHRPPRAAFFTNIGLFVVMAVFAVVIGTVLGFAL
jgi:hypothetical protein